ncbi:MAG: hypothetical protein IM631_21310 [Cytophagales bacterium]|jgi:signal transduction histidine kinase|nr:hypothetical protein [Cytophagales bacterium]MCA6373908.1 hypothetical protein [Cytophagales bacterium]MCA6377846.1 hypothetical protein [Cytophagales bacterium]MCA6383376.1 hypothetical protein [Cytophagales bacterium]
MGRQKIGIWILALGLISTNSYSQIAINQYRSFRVPISQAAVSVADTSTTIEAAQELYYESLKHNFLAPGKCYFIRIPIRSNLDESKTWTFDVGDVHRCDVFTRADGAWRVFASTIDLPWRARGIQFKQFHPLNTQAVVTLAATRQDTIFVKVYPQITKGNLFLFFADDSDSFSSEVLIAMLSTLLAMFLYHFSLFVQNKKVSYLYYSLYLLATCLFVLTNATDATYLSQWFEFFNRFPRYTVVAYLVSAGLLTLMHLLFTIHFIETRSRFPRWHRLFKLSIYVISLAVAVGASFLFITGNVDPINLMAYAIGVAISVMMILFALSQVRNRDQVLSFFKAGIFIMYGTVGCYLILSTLATQGIIKVSLSKLQLRVEFLHAVYFAGIAGELLCFALGLGYKQQLLEKEKQSALQRLVEQQSDMNQHLEELVKSRTAVIQEQKEEIVAQNEELVQQGEELATQRDLLEDQNRIIAKHNRQLEEQVAARTQALMIKADELERQNQQLEQFSHITAHNLRGPVARILGLTNLFDSSHLPAPDNAIIVDKLRVSAQDLDVIIREMSNIVNIQKRNVTLEKVELAPIIKNIITRLKEANLDNYGLKLNLGISVVNAVPSYLESILFHIISNSVKFKNVGTSVSIWIDTVQDRERTKLTIRDDGPGFDQEKLASKLFQPFQRFNLTHSGNGIGLFLVKTQVEAIGGEIKLESAVNRGVTVNIWFSRQ